MPLFYADFVNTYLSNDYNSLSPKIAEFSKTCVMIELQALDWFKTLGTIKHQLPNTSILVGSQGVNLPARQQNKPYNRQKGDKGYHSIDRA